MNIIGNIGLVSLLCTSFLLRADLTLSLRDLRNKPIEQVSAGCPFLLHIALQGVDGALRNLSIEGLDQPNVHGKDTYQQHLRTNATGHVDMIATCRLRIDDPGTYVLGPAHIITNRGKISSLPLSIPVVAARAVSLDDVYAQRTSPYLMAYLSVDKDQVCVGEMVTCSLHLYAASSSQAQLIQCDEPATIAKQWRVVTQAHKVVTQERFKGVEYEVTTWTWSMCPTKSGLITIPAYTFTCGLAQTGRGSFSLFYGFSAEQVALCSNPITLPVEALPQFDKKIDALGALTAYTASIQPAVARTGEGLILTLTLEGEADWSAITPPRLDGMPPSLKWYESQQAMIPGEKPGTFQGKSFEYVVQGVEPGQWLLPAQSYTFFDVTTRSCRTVTTQPIMVTILARPADEQPQQHEHQTQQDSKHATHERAGDDKKDTTALSAIALDEPWEPQRLWQLPWSFFFLLVLIPGGVLAGRPLRRWYERYQALRSPVSLKKKACVRALRAIKQAQQEDTPEKLYAIFMALYGARLSCDPASLQEEGIDAALNMHGFSDEQQREWRIFFHDIAQCAFGHDKSKQHTRTTEHYFETARRWVYLIEEKL